MPIIPIYPLTTPKEIEEEDPTSISNDEPCDVCGKILWINHPEMKDAQCADCGTWFIADMLHTLGVDE